MSEDNHFITRPKLLKITVINDVSGFVHLNFTGIWCKLRQCLPNKTRNSAMEYKSDLKTATIVWWRFFWRYAIIFVVFNLLVGISMNYFGHLLPKGLYLIMLLSGVLANVVATLLVMFYCLDRKFRKSSLIMQGKTANSSNWNKLWIWFLYFWRFAIIAFAIAFILGALLPMCFQYAGVDPVKALKYSKYLGNIAVLPASYLVFISLVCRKEKRQTLKIAVSE